MKTLLKKIWRQPFVEYIGSIEDVEARISSLQKEIEIKRQNFFAEFEPEKVNALLDDLVILKNELTRLQKKYATMLKQTQITTTI